MVSPSFFLLLLRQHRIVQLRAPDIGGHCRPQLGAPDLSGHCQTSTASARSQWALPDLNRERQISVGTAMWSLLLGEGRKDGRTHGRTDARKEGRKSDKVLRPSPGRWGKRKRKRVTTRNETTGQRVLGLSIQYLICIGVDFEKKNIETFKFPIGSIFQPSKLPVVTGAGSQPQVLPPGLKLRKNLTEVS